MPNSIEHYHRPMPARMTPMTKTLMPMRYLHLFALLGLLAGWIPAAHAKHAAPSSTRESSGEHLPSDEIRHVTLAKLSGQTVIPLHGTDGQSTINFNVRKDELLTKAVLTLHYTYSPALLPVLSHIKVYVNDEVVGIAPITKENAGKNVDYQVEINPRLLTDFNRLKLQLIGHYTTDCEDPLHTSLWADISGSSEFAFNVQHLAIRNDLGILPEPFFDRRDSRQLKLPFVFAAHPSLPVLRAAGVAASWFGDLANWRGARFPTLLDSLPTGHAIVFATNDERPQFLKNLPQFAAPGISVITNPADGYSKLLLITGRNGDDLQIATRALVLGNAALSGTEVTVDKATEVAPRTAYDAPRWVRLDRPMKFGELVESPQELQVQGPVPRTIGINLRIPPDLFTWHSRGVPVNLKYRYTPPILLSESRLNVSINNELVRSFNLRTTGQGGESSRVRLPLIDEGLFGETEELFLPSFKLGFRNQLQYNFSFVTQKQGLCRDNMVDNIRSMIDADSTIDFSGYPHYAEMPNLATFSSLGFPFTKYADLAQTTVVMPEHPAAEDIEVMLTVLGHLGESTGYPATRFTLTGPQDEAKLKDADILVIGSAMQQSLLKKWHDQLPVTIEGSAIKDSQPQRSVNMLYDWLGFETKPNPGVATQEQLEGNGSLAAILGFESPLSAGRSVVAITATAPANMEQALDALDHNANSMQGSTVFIRGDDVKSSLVGKTYYVGSLPFWTSIWYPLSKHPILLAVMSVLAILIFAFALWRSFKAVAQRRLQRDDE